MVLATALTLAGCDHRLISAEPKAAQVIQSSARAESQPVTKVLVVVEENHTLVQMRSGMPFVNALARQYGYATDYHAVAHPSLPNYLALTTGSTFRLRSDPLPKREPIRGLSIFASAARMGRTARVYAEGMPANCWPLRDPSTGYDPRMNPWTYFVNDRPGCLANDVPLTRLKIDLPQGGLPDVGFVVPNRCHDAHDCSVAAADRWFETLMGEIFAGPDWRSGHLAVVLTADEDDHHGHNTVLTVVVHPSQHHHVVRRPLSHYSLLRLLEDVVEVPHQAAAARSPSMSTAFGLPVGHGGADGPTHPGGPARRGA